MGGDGDEVSSIGNTGFKEKKARKGGMVVSIDRGCLSRTARICSGALASLRRVTIMTRRE